MEKLGGFRIRGLGFENLGFWDQELRALNH